jgi:predicted PurR-regulated permease PerM
MWQPNGAAVQEADGGADPPGRAIAVAVTGLFVLGVLYTLYFARVVVLPVVLASLLSFILSPIVRWLRRRGLPDAVGALAVLAVLSSASIYGAYTLSAPAIEWLDTAPQAFRRIEDRLRFVRSTVAEVTETTDRMEKLAGVSDDDTRVVTVRGKRLSEILFAGTWNFIAAMGIVLILAYFFLASGDLFLRKLVRAVPRLSDKKRAVEIARSIEDSVSAYLFTVSLINAGLGLAVGAALWWAGMPNPVLWGVVAAMANFVPYVGQVVAIAFVAAVAVLSFDSLGQALVPPALYFVFNTVEAYLVTPVILSRRFTLNPVTVLLGLLFWGWIWGIPGALLAVPLLVTFKILCDNLKALQPIGELLGGRE